ncbi:thermonuclease family protein [Frigidibacter sp. MR17.24]|uniref:thermonuclease family protein n=1 Tax=Frigidibacter sp. MR17.24 TaxID=3127345 RepID=UPI0030131CE2
MRRLTRLVPLIAALCLAGAPAVAQVLTGRPQVHDGDTLRLGGERIRLFGIDAPELAQSCTNAEGRDWDCGGWSRHHLAALAGREIRCEGIERDRYDRLVARCFRRGRDLGAQMVEDGAAFAYRAYALDYVDAEKRAAIAARGLWAGAAERPADWRAAQRAAAPDPAPPQAGCAIKGNISGNGHLYHLPGMASYGATRIDTARGERWFCSEAQARAAGWRRAGGS